jgi:hypothetical protein
MNGCGREFSLKAASRARAALRLGGAAAVCATLAAWPASARPSFGAGYPSFASVPAAPKDVRPMADWRKAVLDTRVAGARLSRRAAKEPWTLGDTAGWSARIRNEAAPPPAITTASEAETQALVKALKARASRPSRSR